jgi:hypothetical protein
MGDIGVDGIWVYINCTYNYLVWRMTLAERVARLGEKWNAYRLFVGKP